MTRYMGSAMELLDRYSYIERLNTYTSLLVRWGLVPVRYRTEYELGLSLGARLHGRLL